MKQVMQEYPTTHWSQISLASEREHEAGFKALGGLLQQYSRPLLMHLQYRFNATEDTAREWLHGFIERRILAQHFLQKANRRRGRFRTFLLNALDNFVRDDFRARNGPQRNPAGGLVSLEDLPDQAGCWAADDPLDPFDLGWACTILERAKAATRRFYCRKGRASTWAVFNDAALVSRPLRPSSAELAEKHGFASARQVDNAIVTASREFGKQLCAVVAEYVEDPDDALLIAEEIRDLIRILSQPQFWRNTTD